jgi:hypothetical protein
MIGGLLEAADMALNSSGETTITRGEAQDGCCIAGALRTEPLAHVALPFSAIAAGLRGINIAAGLREINADDAAFEPGRPRQICAAQNGGGLRVRARCH